MEIAINGEVFSLSHEPGSVSLTLPVANYAAMLSGYQQRLRLHHRQPSLCFGRPTPLIALEITITPLDADASVLIQQALTPRKPITVANISTKPGAGVWSASDAGELHHPGWTHDVAISCCCKVSGDVQQCYTAKSAVYCNIPVRSFMQARQ